MRLAVVERLSRYSLTPTLKRLGIRYRRPYNCRHTYATALIMANANHKWASLQMGHSVEMFQKTYTKWIDGDQNEAEMAKLEANLKTQISTGLALERGSAT
jgi:integrase